jgi:SnoaL-like domain
LQLEVNPIWKLDHMDLVALEEIRQLKYRYLRCVDLKLWDEIGDVFTADASADYGTHAVREPLHLRGRDEIVSYLRENLGPEIITVHRCGQPEISVDGDKATGTWSFEDTVIATAFRVVIKGAAFYEDTYERCADGKWRLSHIGYQRIYETMSSLDDTPSLRFIDNMWAPKKAS